MLLFALLGCPVQEGEVAAGATRHGDACVVAAIDGVLVAEVYDEDPVLDDIDHDPDFDFYDLEVAGEYLCSADWICADADTFRRDLVLVAGDHDSFDADGDALLFGSTLTCVRAR